MTDYPLPTLNLFEDYPLPTLNLFEDDNTSSSDISRFSWPSSASTTLNQSQPFNQDSLQKRLQAIIEVAGESWTYAIFWQHSIDDSSGASLLGWGDGYYKGGEEDKLTKRKTTPTSAADQENRKKVLRELNSFISDQEEEVTDTEWFFIVSMTKSFINGGGLPGQAFYSSVPVWIAGHDRLAASVCVRAKQAQELGLQTVVCIPFNDSVVELGSTDLIFQSSDLINRVRVLFNFNNNEIGSWLPSQLNVDQGEIDLRLRMNVLSLVENKDSQPTIATPAPPVVNVQHVPLSKLYQFEKSNSSNLNENPSMINQVAHQHQHQPHHQQHSCQSFFSKEFNFFEYDGSSTRNGSLQSCKPESGEILNLSESKRNSTNDNLFSGSSQIVHDSSKNNRSATSRGSNDVHNSSSATSRGSNDVHDSSKKKRSVTSRGSNDDVASESNTFTLAQVSNHNNLKDCWLLINHKVYDVTKFLGDHPGGIEVLLKCSGKDASTDFKKTHSHSSNAVTMMDKFYVGVYDSISSSLSKLASDKPQPYSWVQLKEFTKDFSQLLGSGGFGEVYKGQFPNGVFVAVKVLKNIEYKEKIMEEQFVAEVDTMGRAYHRNLIKLYGYCYEANTKFKALVYDYMENGSFDTILFDKKLDIPWSKLHNIAKEIAHGIAYLHESCSPQIIHQDIKPSNVLLDSNLSPKVIDFGLAKVNLGESQFEQTKIKGSRDYMAPEVNQPKQVKLSCKVDVYSFGKMLFDILGSKRNKVDKSGFPGQVWEKYKAHQLDKFILDCGIKEEDKENAKKLAIIALLCVEHNPRARPMLSNVVKMLEGKIKVDTPVAPFYPDYYSSESCSMSDSRDY